MAADPGNQPFGKAFTDRMFSMTYRDGEGWSSASVHRYKPFEMDPAARVLHYSQEIFEGLKAYKGPDGETLLFRPEANAQRLNRSAARVCMPQIPEEDFLAILKELLTAEERWVPSTPGTSLYIRPTMIATEPALGVHPSSEYIFYVILSPVGAYFKEGFKPVSLFVEDTYARAVVGGVGEAKTGGNYAASLLGGQKAEKLGYSQMLWLDAKEHKYVEEVGAMNIFFVFGDTLVTPPLTGSILPGITRDSILTLAKSLGYKAEERQVSIDEVIEGAKTGVLKEAFGAGTAAVIAPVGVLGYKGTDYSINDNQVGPITEKLYTSLTSIQTGLAPDPFGWVKRVQDL